MLLARRRVAADDVIDEVLGHAGRVGTDGRRLPHGAALEHAERLCAPPVHRVTLKQQHNLLQLQNDQQKHENVHLKLF